jgi:hypothetical protein
MRKARVD